MSEYWRSLAERDGREELRPWVEREFPPQASEWVGGETSRRDFLRLMAASLAMANAAGCSRQPAEVIVPAVETPEFTPGKVALSYASAAPMTGGALGVLVTSHEGRPTKVEGNEQHPASLGATDIFAQAAVLGLYDPDRSQVVRAKGQISNWNQFLSSVAPLLETLRAEEGRGLHILSLPVHSPTLSWQREQLLEQFPAARWHEYEPVESEAASVVFGEAVRPIYHFDQADVVLSVDADFLGFGPASVRSAIDFSERRKQSIVDHASAMSRLYVVESTFTLTGAKADHRWPLSPGEIERFLRTLAGRLGVAIDPPAEEFNGISAAAWDALVEDFTDSSRRPLVLAGPWHSSRVHALVHLINEKIGAVGQTVTYVDPLPASDQASSLADLVESLNRDEVTCVLILDGNPVFTAPADLGFREALQKAPHRLHFGLEFDETAAECTWHVPAVHWLETWSDVRAFDGTVSIIQPLIAPLYQGRNVHELLNVFLNQSAKTPYDTVREFWRQQHSGEDFEAFWQQSLHDGIIPETGFSEKSVTVMSEVLSELSPSQESGPSAGMGDTVEVLFRPHPTVWDGRFANNAWLQELPQPFTKLTWGNAALIGAETAARYGLKDGDVVEMRVGERRITIPVAIVPGQAEGAATLHFGCGRTRSGRVGTNVGVDVYPLRTTTAPWTATAQLRTTGEHVELATTQHHFLMEGRDLVRHGDFSEVLSGGEHPSFMQDDHAGEELPSFYQEDHLTSEYQWGMAIDLTACIGCSACTIACQAENNIPVVGAEEVLRGREMHWIRVDTYYHGEAENPEAFHQPLPCMHCEHAPCEVVCPVAATTHSHEGLNEMTYNRCIGTRYCSNNCPYKVRRFNFFDYQEETRELPVLQLMQNPNVTVRSRGVMEKCTYCVQRINAARIGAEIEQRPIGDGDVVTACQAVCPTRAIVFGNIRDPNSAVSQQQKSALNYSLLKELNTRPRTTYLAAVRNPHPLLVEEAQ